MGISTTCSFLNWWVSWPYVVIPNFSSLQGSISGAANTCAVTDSNIRTPCGGQFARPRQWPREGVGNESQKSMPPENVCVSNDIGTVYMFFHVFSGFSKNVPINHSYTQQKRQQNAKKRISLFRGDPTGPLACINSWRFCSSAPSKSSLARWYLWRWAQLNESLVHREANPEMWNWVPQ